MKSSLILTLSTAGVLLGIGVLAFIRPRPAVMEVAAGSRTPAEAGAAGEAASPDEGFLGVVVARETVDVSGRGEGRVVEMRVRLGDRVAKDDVLAVLDTSLLREELAMVQAALRGAKAEAERATLELAEARERYARRLRPTESKVQALSEEELANARYQAERAAPSLEALRARVAEQGARVAQLEQFIADAQIRAPFDGVVATRYVNVGSLVTRGTPVVRLVSAGDLWVRFAVPEEDAGRVRVGLALAVSVADIEARLSAVVEKVAPEVDTASRMVVAEARLALPPELDQQIVVGRVARVRRALASAPSARKP